MPGAGMVAINFARTWREAVDLNDKIDEARDILTLKREAKKRMEAVIGQFDKLEYRVAYLRDIERKPLKEIADNLNFSYDWIRKVSQRVKRLRITS
jgi:DNA-directed RNA polymerase specialized sigma24 family protein